MLKLSNITKRYTLGGSVLGGAAVDDEVAAGVAVQAADDVQGGGLAAARGAQTAGW